MKTKRHTIDLTPQEVSALLEVAEKTNSFARAGRSYNLPSWRALVRDIAAGRVACKDKLQLKKS